MARILLGVSGGIAAYKAVELARLAIKAGHSVRVVQTPTSLSFVGKATFEGVTGAPALVDEFEPDPARGAFPGDPAPDHAPISHLELVRRADVYAIVPASANTLAKLANGLADNLLASAALASPAPRGHRAARRGRAGLEGRVGRGPAGRAARDPRGHRAGDGPRLCPALARRSSRARDRGRHARADRLGALRRQPLVRAHGLRGGGRG